MEMGLEVRNAKNSRLRGLDEVIPGRGPAPCRSLGGTAWSEQPRSVRLGELCRLVGEGSQPLKGGGAQRERGHPGKTGAGLGQRGPGRAEARGTERCERAERGGWMRRGPGEVVVGLPWVNQHISWSLLQGVSSPACHLCWERVRGGEPSWCKAFS